MLGLPAIVGAAFLLLTLLARLLPGVDRVFGVTSRVGGTFGRTGQDAATELAGGAGRLAAAAVVLVGLGLLYAVALQAVQAVLVQVVAEAALGRRRSVGWAWASVRSRVARLVGLVLVQSAAAIAVLAVVGGLTAAAVAASVAALHGAGRIVVVVLLVLVGVAAAVTVTLVLYVRWVLAPAVLLLDDRLPVPAGTPPPGVGAALRRSWALVRGSGWRVLGILVVVGLLAQVVAGLLSVPLSLVGYSATLAGAGSGHQTAGLLGSATLAGIGSLAGAVLALPFTMAATTLLYLDLRMRRDSLDLRPGAEPSAVSARPDLPGWY